MKLIPAVDLKQGLVVHARGGQRDNYLPVCTRYFPDARPLKLIDRLMEVCRPDVIYLADLDAIQERGSNRAVVEQIRRHFPDLGIWFDHGLRRRAGLISLISLISPIKGSGVTPVVGTETLRDDISRFRQDDYILSLDFSNGKLLGDDVLARYQEWPLTVIALSLDSVGAGRGPDLRTLRQLRGRYKGELIAGGGVRDGGDLEALGGMGVNGALAATAIYDGKLAEWF